MLTDKYIAYIEGVRRYSPRTALIYRDALERFGRWSLSSPGESGADKLNPTMLRNYEVHLLDEEGESSRTVNLHLSILSGYCKFLMKQGELGSNPVRLVRRPKEEKRLPVFYRKDAMLKYFEDSEFEASGEQLEFLLSMPAGSAVAVQVYEDRLRRVILSALFSTGIRRSELIGLNISSLDIKRKTLTVRGKGDKTRDIPLTDTLCEEISLYLSAADHMFGQSREAETPLFRTAKGARLYPVYVDRAVKKELGTQKGFPGRKSPHVLRHTIASELLDGGTDLNSIKELLGHSSLAATQVYTHNTIERLKTVYANAHPRAKNGGKNGD